MAPVVNGDTFIRPSGPLRHRLENRSVNYSMIPLLDPVNPVAIVDFDEDFESHDKR